MFNPEEVRFACIGCGALNPVGAEVCSGCGHRFAGPVGGSTSGSVPSPSLAISEMHFRDDDLDKPRRPNPDEMLLGCLAKVFGITVTVIATPIAFVVAFFATCSATFQTHGSLIWSFAAGLTAAGVVIAFAVLISYTIRAR